MYGERNGMDPDATTHTTDPSTNPFESTSTDATDQPFSLHDFSLDAPQESLQRTQMSVSGHSRGQDSFSRSRTSTETAFDTSNPFDAADDHSMPWDPQSASSDPLEPAAAGDVDDAFSALDQTTELNTAVDPATVRDARDELEAWSQLNADPEIAPVAERPSTGEQTLESRPTSLAAVNEGTQAPHPASLDTSLVAPPGDFQSSHTVSDSTPTEHPVFSDEAISERKADESTSMPLMPAPANILQELRPEGKILDTQETGPPNHQQGTSTRGMAVLPPKRDSMTLPVVQESQKSYVAENGNDSFGAGPFSSKTDDDAWAQALGVGESEAPKTAPVPSAREQSISTSDADARLAATDVLVKPRDETLHELRESLIQPSHEEATPLPPADDGFLSAVKEVSQDLELPSEGINSPETQGEPVKPAPDFDESDSWEKELAATKPADGDASWESAFGDALDDDGFLDDGEGFLEETPNVARNDHSAILTQRRYGVETNKTSAPMSTDPGFSNAANFHAGPPPQTPQSDTSRLAAGGMKFFEDLPMTQPMRSKRPRQIVPNLQSPNAVPPPGPRSGPPPLDPRRPSSSQQGSYPQLVGPQKLEMFPPQPTQPPPLSTTASIVSSASPHAPSLQPPIATNSRYSPAPSQPAPAISRYANVSPHAPPAASRYSPAQDAARGPNQTSTASSNNSSMIPPGPHGPTANSYAPQYSETQYNLPPAPRRADSRYSPAPPPQRATRPALPADTINQQLTSSDGSLQHLSGPPPPPIPAQRFIPRTSSPLRPGARPQVDRSHALGAPPQQGHDYQPAPQPTLPEKAPPLPRSVTQAGYSAQALHTQSSVSLPIEPSEAAPPRFTSSSQTPQRPRTQSPETSRGRYATSSNEASRKASVQDSITGFPASTAYAPVPFTTTGPSSSDNMNFVKPTESAQASDPMNRWKGSPSVQWCPGGSVAIHFPKHLPRYGGGQSAPAIKCSPGDIKLHRSKEAMPADESLGTFPGPLKSKSKKKELLAWLTNRIEILQRELSTTQPTSIQPRANERLLLWKVVRTLVDNDGQLSGNPTADMAVRQLFASPADVQEVSASNFTAAPSSQSMSDPQTVQDIRQFLLQGDREKAVWKAVDTRQWGHAMLISSTMDGTLWKQVAQEFVRTEVRSATYDNKSLAALYAIFSHNWEESIDELVPASARAGFQMMPAAGASSQALNNLGGLNNWQETLSLVLQNRSSEDEKGLLALGKLLRGYGRIEAAHICFLFSKSVAQFGGVDDPETNFTLLGTDVGADAVHDTDAILLSEAYEFSGLLVTSSTTHYMPHLQGYKLHHAHALAEGGYRNEALQYCDAISAAIKSTTRPSPYYHPVLITQLDDLTKRLSQSPKDSSSSWLTKPSVGKVSSGMWAKFNNFVAGDDDSASNGSGQPMENEAGPFSRITSGTPTISRSASFADVSTLQPGGPLPSNSRYAPSYAPQAPTPHSSNQPAMSARDARRPSSSSYSDFRPPVRSDSFHPPQSAYNPIPHNQHHLGFSDNMSQASSSYDPPILQPPVFGSSPATGSPHGTRSSSRAASSHGPSSSGPQEHEMSAIDEEGPFSSKSNGYQPAVNGYTPTSAAYGSPYEPQTQMTTNDSDPPQQSTYDPSAGGGYEPPSGGYNPYEPGSPASPTSPEKVKPKKKMFMEDDEDEYSGRQAGSMSGGARSAASTREPDDAVRKAAEADAARDKAALDAKKSGSWFPTLGLFNRGAKDPNAPVVHKAKLGEESSFYYDPDSKKWVNKKAGASVTTPGATATPPPPRAGPPMGGGSRAPSGTGTPDNFGGGPPMSMGLGTTPPVRASSALGSTPPTGMPIPGLGISQPTPSSGDLGPSSRAATPASDAGSAHSHAQPPVPNPSGLQPPSRPPTSMSNASSIDDLIGAPGTAGARKGGTMKKGKKGGGRYVDVMAK